MAGRIMVRRGDITKLDVEAIVNAANSTLLGGGGVDGAIHRAAGPELLAACRQLDGAATGEVKVTPGFGLPARHVLHAVGPVWHGGGRGEPDLLASCYRRALALAAAHEISSVAFPAISTGAYRFPLEAATRIAVRTVVEVLRDHPEIALVVFCCFSAGDLATYVKVLEEETSAGPGADSGH